jgi:hypothetical protein
MSPIESRALEEYVSKELRDRKIRKSNSPVAAPCFCVKKADGSLRLVVDYRKINAITVPNHFPMPNQIDLIEKLKEAKIFSKMDIRWGFNNIHIKAGDEWKTAFRTSRGQYKIKDVARESRVRDSRRLRAKNPAIPALRVRARVRERHLCAGFSARIPENPAK